MDTPYALLPDSQRLIHPDTQRWLEVLERAEVPDRLRTALKPLQWQHVLSHMQPFSVLTGQCVITQGAGDRTLYLVESAQLSVHREDERGRVRLAVVGPGAVVGEGAFFSRLPRTATVQATRPGRLWALLPARSEELMRSRPDIALALTVGVAGVLAQRLAHASRRAAVT